MNNQGSQLFFGLFVGSLGLAFLVVQVMETNYAQAQVFPQTAREGTDASIKAEDIADIQSWEGKSKESLDNGRKEIEKLDTAQKRTAYAALLDEVVKASGNRENELLMRVTLNRAQTMNEILNANSLPTGQQDGLARRIFRNSINVALQVFVDDSNFLENSKRSNGTEMIYDLPYASVGIQMAAYFASQAILAPSHPATFVMLVETLGWLFRDLNKGLTRQKFKEVLDSIRAFDDSVIASAKPRTPSEYLRLDQKIKGFIDEQIEKAKQVPGVPQKALVLVRPKNQTSSGAPAKEIQKEVRNVCGTGGDFKARISDCTTSYGKNWNLVSKDRSTFVVYENNKTGVWLIHQFKDNKIWSFSDIESFCDSANVNGLSGWRLPHEAEAKKAYEDGFFEIGGEPLDSINAPDLQGPYADRTASNNNYGGERSFGDYATIRTDKKCDHDYHLSNHYKDFNGRQKRLIITNSWRGEMCDKQELQSSNPNHLKTIVCKSRRDF